MKGGGARCRHLALALALAAGLAALASGCRGTEEASAEEASAEGASAEPARPEGRLAGVGERGRYAFELRLSPEAPAVGEIFRVVTHLRDAKTAEPVTGAEFSLDATMPHHGHGMTTAPRHRELGGGAYLSEGMKLHMPGAWTFVARASRGGAADALSLVREQPPRARP